MWEGNRWTKNYKIILTKNLFQNMLIFFFINSFYKVADLMELNNFTINLDIKHPFKDKNRYQEWQCSKISYSPPILWKPTLLAPAITWPYFASLRIWYALEYALERIDVCWDGMSPPHGSVRLLHIPLEFLHSNVSDCLTNPITFIDLHNCL